MTEPNKDVIYIDIDDEITAIIDKVSVSKNKIVALVLPKRASVFQSIVNMKLLSRSAEQAKKHLVLITSEAGLLPLAGAVGLRVAKSLTSKPVVPIAPVTGLNNEESIEEDPSEVTVATAGNRPIGELAAIAGGSTLTTSDGVETIEIDNEEEPVATESPEATTGQTPTIKKNKKLRVPNFNRFRLWLVFGVLGLGVVILLFYLANIALPKATIAIKTDASNVNTNVNFTLDTGAKSLDTTQNIIPAKQVQEQKTYTQASTTTGQKNIGAKASGSVSMSAKECNTFTPPAYIPAGTGISTNGLTFITQQDTTFGSPQLSGSNCISYQSSSATPVIAQSPGVAYNVAPTTFSVAGRSNDVTASSNTAMTGGTDDIVQVVAQADIDSAKQKISTTDTSVQQDLVNQLSHVKLYAFTSTFSPGTPTITTSANVGDTADSVTVTEVVTYTMFGAKQSDLQTLLAANINSQIDTTKQSILDDGLNSASFKTLNNTATTIQLNIQTLATVGPDLSVNSIKKLVAGKKSGDIETLLKSNPGVTSIDVKFSPFWVTTAPQKVSKITVIIAKPTQTVNAH
ncbi:MAG TPA: hypothetical protein VNE40_03500 [Candidatus Dormibacteraeota bacterium]|nr:hypothetical protein [Candidatus Dormibacteraeota bacterium]